MDDGSKISNLELHGNIEQPNEDEQNHLTLNNDAQHLLNAVSNLSTLTEETATGTTVLIKNENEHLNTPESMFSQANSESNIQHVSTEFQVESQNNSDESIQNSFTNLNQSTNSNEPSPQIQKTVIPEPKNKLNRSPRQTTSSSKISTKDILRVITTIDTKRPPSGYSDYSYSYEYSEDDENGETTHRKRSKNDSKHQKKPKYILKISEEEFNNLKSKALKFEPLENLENDVYEALISSLGKDRKRSALQEDFDQSNLLTSAIEHVVECQLEQKKYLLQQQKYEEYVNKMKEVLQQLKDFDEQTVELENEIHLKETEQMHLLQLAHQAQIDQHEKEWSNGSKTKQYNHASTRLLFLRKQYQQLVQQCRFKEAANVKTEINILEKKEGLEAMKLMQEHYDASLKKIQKKQSDEIKSLKQRYDSLILKLNQSRSKERIPLQSREMKLKKMEDILNDPDKLWNFTQTKRLQDDVKSRSSGRLPKATARIQPKEITLKQDTKIKLPALNTRKSK